MKGLQMTDHYLILKQCRVSGNVVALPDMQLDRKLYLEVKKQLELIGGKWNRKAQGFLFQQDPAGLLERLTCGEKVNLKKEYQFFETPPELADRLVNLSGISMDDYILEPSAGQGAIVKAIHRRLLHKVVHYFELMEINRSVMLKTPFTLFRGEDFLKEAQTAEGCNKIIANPPFSKNQDIDHILKMYEILSPGGRIVTLASKHWQTSRNKKEVAFVNWVEDHVTDVYSVDAGTFKTSGTNIETLILVIDK